jgi:hypothetical protein
MSCPRNHDAVEQTSPDEQSQQFTSPFRRFLGWNRFLVVEGLDCKAIAIDPKDRYSEPNEAFQLSVNRIRSRRMGE